MMREIWLEEGGWKKSSFESTNVPDDRGLRIFPSLQECDVVEPL